MENNLKFIEKNKAIIKKSWLEHYRQNSAFFEKILENWFTIIATPDGGYRVKAEWILGFLSGKYPQFTKMLYTLYIGNDNLEEIINILGLNFDPRKELKKSGTNNNQSSSSVFDKLQQKCEDLFNFN